MTFAEAKSIVIEGKTIVRYSPDWASFGTLEWTEPIKYFFNTEKIVQPTPRKKYVIEKIFNRPMFSKTHYDSSPLAILKVKDGYCIVDFDMLIIEPKPTKYIKSHIDKKLYKAIYDETNEYYEPSRHFKNQEVLVKVIDLVIKSINDKSFFSLANSFVDRNRAMGWIIRKTFTELSEYPYYETLVESICKWYEVSKKNLIDYKYICVNLYGGRYKVCMIAEFKLNRYFDVQIKVREGDAFRCQSHAPIYLTKTKAKAEALCKKLNG